MRGNTKMIDRREGNRMEEDEIGADADEVIEKRKRTQAASAAIL